MHPVVLLVNEIDDLQAQTRLIEISLKEAQSAAKDSITRMEREHNGKMAGLRAALTSAVESARAENQILRARIGELESAVSSANQPQATTEGASYGLTAEITRLRSTLAQQECAAARQEAAFRADLDQLAAEIHRRHDELEQQREFFKQASVEIESLRREIAVLKEKDRGSEPARKEVERNLRAGFAAGLTSQVPDVAKPLYAKIHELQSHLAEKQLLAESRAVEIVNLKADLNHVTCQLAQRELIEHEVKDGPAEARQISDRPATEETSMEIGDSKNQLTGRAAELQPTTATQSALEQSLRNEIDRLLHEVHEKNQILQDRNDELVQVKAEMDRLQERLNQLEASTGRAHSALVGDAERMHTEFQAQLALLQAELSQKEWALEERQAAARGVEQKYRQEIEALRRQLAQREAVMNPSSGECLPGDPGLAATAQQPDAAKRTEFHAEEVDLRKSRVHWHGGFGRKRRWRG